MSILKTTVLLEMFAANKVLAVNKVDIDEGNVELIKKSIKLKTGKMSKGQKLVKSKKPLKSENLFTFAIKKVGPGFLISDFRITFNRLRFAYG